MMAEQQASERDVMLIDEVLKEARKALAQGRAGVAALLASPHDIIAHGRNTSQETGDLTDHAEMVLLHQAGKKLQEMDERARRSLSLYVTLEPCLMCSAALSYVGIKRIVYAASAEDANVEEMIVRDLTLPKINPPAPSARSVHPGPRHKTRGRAGFVTSDEQGGGRAC